MGGERRAECETRTSKSITSTLDYICICINVSVRTCTHIPNVRHAARHSHTRIYIHTYIYIYIGIYQRTYIRVEYSRAEHRAWGRREEKGRGTIAMDAVEYKEAQAVLDRRDSRPSARGHFDGRKKHRTELGAEGGRSGRRRANTHATTPYNVLFVTCG